MEKSKLISVRIYPETLAQIDAIAKTDPALTRSVIINQLLYNCVACASPAILFRLYSTFHAADKGMHVEFGTRNQLRKALQIYEDEYKKAAADNSKDI